MTLKEVLVRTTDFFKQKNFSSPRLEAELLLAQGLNMSRVELYLKFDKPLSEKELADCREVVRRRAFGESLAYITGRKGFFGLDFKVGPGVLVPRPETEHLVEIALNWIKTKLRDQSLIRILDMGTGSGCVGLSILAKCQQAEGVLVDSSAAAIQYAKENSIQLGLSERVKIIESRVEELSGLEPFDIIVGNPPYISKTDPDIQESVKEFEPHEALFSDDEGLQAIRNWISVAVRLSKNSGLVSFEIGYQQGSAVEQIFKSTSVFSKIEVSKDLAGYDRNVTGVINE